MVTVQLQNKGVSIYKPKEVKVVAMFPKFVTTRAMFRLKKIDYKTRSRAEYMRSFTGPWRPSKMYLDDREGVYKPMDNSNFSCS